MRWMRLSSVAPLPRWLEIALLLVLTVIGLGLRQTNLMTIPPLTDEFKEVGWAMTMVEKDRFPLVAFDAYDGPLFPYLLSFLFRIFGFNIYLPRVFVLLVGVLTIVVVYLFARELARGDYRVALFAAALLTVNAHHILFNSHVAWSNDITPFFTTLALYCFIRAERLDRARWLVAAGFFYGLAVQTHPSALALAPALIIYYVLNPLTRAKLKSPAPYLAALAALVAYSPVIYYNLTIGFRSLTFASEAEYAFETAPTLTKTLEHVGPLLATFAQVGLGTFGSTSTSALWTDPRVGLFWLGTLLALVYLIRRGEYFPPVALIASLSFLAVFNRFYAVPDSARYFQSLLPVLFAAWAWVGVGLVDEIFAHKPLPGSTGAGQSWRLWLRRGSVLLLPLGFVALAWTSLTGLNLHYADAQAKGQTNEAMLNMVTAVRADRSGPVLIDWELAQLRTKRGGNVAENLIYLLSLDRREYKLVSALRKSDAQGLRDYLMRLDQAYLISFSLAPDMLGASVPLEKLVGTRFACNACPVPEEFALFRWEEP